ncbi:hypothetical protein Megpolyxen_00023 [Candidatus Megaera polyxenophila]|nr:hypothetical protein Megpolyxen_00023 [Candidatus Megaera polyxenophila]
MSKATKPIDIPLRASKKSLVGIGQNLLSDEGGSVELVVGKPTRYSKSAKEEIETDKIDILSPSLESNSFMSGSDLQSLSLAEEVSVPKKLESEGFSALLAQLSAFNKENITSAPLVSVSGPELAKETPSISLHAISEPISIPSSSKSIMPMVSESLADDTFLLVTGSDKNSEIVATLQSNLQVNKKSLESDYELIQEEQGITSLSVKILNF